MAVPVKAPALTMRPTVRFAAPSPHRFAAHGRRGLRYIFAGPSPPGEDPPPSDRQDHPRAADSEGEVRILLPLHQLLRYHS
jgi:hypothetical protein